jgi:hypothetical protein
VWEVVGTTEFESWYLSLTEPQAGAVDARIDLLQEVGPTLGRPTVDHIEGSRHHNMKEIRCSKDGALRVLFIYDPIRRAALLLGGNKADDSEWSDWYATAIPRADDIYERYLDELRREGLIP